MKKVIAGICALIMLFGLVACGEAESSVTQLGTSKLYLTLPEGYAPAEDDYSEDQVAYFRKDDQSIDFDVYQWSKNGEYTLESEAEFFASQYGTTPSEVEINGIKGMKYVSEEDYEGKSYTVINYMFDDGEDIVEVCFWTINTEEELADVDQIINTLAKK